MIVVYDVDGREHRINVIKEREHYMIEIDHEFFCSCDNRREVDEMIPVILRIYNYSYVQEVNGDEEWR